MCPAVVHCTVVHCLDISAPAQSKPNPHVDNQLGMEFGSIRLLMKWIAAHFCQLKQFGSELKNTERIQLIQKTDKTHVNIE